MKKIIFFLILLSIPLISAVNIDMNTQFSQGETLIAKISGNFLEPLQKENIFFYKGHVKIPLDYDLAKINEDYYLYAQLGTKEPENYSLRIENSRYFQGNDILKKDIIINFTITNNTADFKISPGFIITDKPFSIEIKNLQDNTLNIEINQNKTQENINFFKSLFLSSELNINSIELSPAETKQLQFDLGNKTSFNFIRLTTENTDYEIPVYLFVTQTSNQKQDLVENPAFFEQDKEENFENQTLAQKQEIKTVSTKTCVEENGIVCMENEKCNGTIEYAADSVCCLGSCEIIQKKNTGKILGWSMIILIILALAWFFFKKYKPASKEINLLKIAKGKK